MRMQMQMRLICIRLNIIILMHRQIIQQSEIKAPKSHLTETQVKAEATATAVEQFTVSYSTPGKTTLGGYGEVHYNNLETGDASSTKEAIDFHRCVMFTGYQFTDSPRFLSELEVERSIAGEGKVS